MRARRFITLTATCGALALVLPAAAAANAFTTALKAYNNSATATLNACQFSSTTLAAALKEMPSYYYQYDAEFANALQAAISAQDDGQCRSHSSLSKSQASSLGRNAKLGGASDSALPGSVTGASGAGLPLVLLLAFALAAVCLLAALIWAGGAVLGLDPRWTRNASHSLREAEYRISAAWVDLTDRFRR